MIIELTKFLYSLSTAMDYVEAEIIKTARNHMKRVAVIANRMAKAHGMDEEAVFALTQAAVLHDCALSEYLQDELTDGKRLDELNMSAHCLGGEEMLQKLPIYKLVEGAVLYHHERADGNGAFRKTAEETPMAAQLIHMADVIDFTFRLDALDPAKYQAILQYVAENRGTVFTDECADLFLETTDYASLLEITGEGVRPVLRGMLPEFTNEVDVAVLREMASVFARITDYKSRFTWRHSLGIAEKAEKIGHFYGCTDEECSKLYIAGALHDLGKLLIGNNILEKPGKLTADEYKVIQNHAMGTWELLHGIGGMEEICSWASLHHEKLDGSGYPFGYTAKDLGRNERLLACLDIYQALVEERPYKSGMPHGKAMEILNSMGEAGQLDTDILRDVDSCFGGTAAESTEQTAPDFSHYTEEAWRCPVCGYVYEGSLPASFICPQCEQPASIFKKIAG